MITLVLGGTRSGKSEVAERLASTLPQPVTFVATGIATDDDMRDRIESHRARRPPAWRTVDCEGDLVATLRTLDGTVLVDSLGTWVAQQPALAVDVDGLVAVLAERSDATVVVSEEVGLSVHSTTDVGRRFVDTLGTLNLAVASRADDVLLVVAGRSLRLPAPDA